MPRNRPLTQQHAPARQLNDDGPNPVERQSKSQIDDKTKQLCQEATHQRKLEGPSCILHRLNDEAAIEIGLRKPNFGTKQRLTRAVAAT